MEQGICNFLDIGFSSSSQTQLDDKFINIIKQYNNKKTVIKKIYKQIPNRMLSFKSIKDLIYCELDQIFHDVQLIKISSRIARQDLHQIIHYHFGLDPVFIQEYNKLFHKENLPVYERYQHRYLAKSKFHKIHTYKFDNIFNASVAFIGLQKGNGVIINKEGFIISNDHIFNTETGNNCTYRAFITGDNITGIAKLRYFSSKYDLSLSQIIYIYNPTDTWSYIQIKELPYKFATSIPVILVGLLLDENIEIAGVFQCGIGWIEKYTQDEHKTYISDIKEDIAPLIHSAFTMPGTSGSGLFDCEGRLVGLHQGQNESQKSICITKLIIDKLTNKISLTISNECDRHAVPYFVIAKFLDSFFGRLYDPGHSL
jgi:hypothetical protein